MRLDEKTRVVVTPGGFGALTSLVVLVVTMVVRVPETLFAASRACTP